MQRGRDHGIPDYNTCRAALGFAKAQNFSDVTSDPLLQVGHGTYGSNEWRVCDGTPLVLLRT